MWRHGDLDEGCDLAQIEELLGCAGRKQVQAPGDDSRPAGLVVGT
jgi:hypothetical protein